MWARARERRRASRSCTCAREEWSPSNRRHVEPTRGRPPSPLPPNPRRGAHRPRHGRVDVARRNGSCRPPACWSILETEQSSQRFPEHPRVHRQSTEKVAVGRVLRRGKGATATSWLCHARFPGRPGVAWLPLGGDPDKCTRRTHEGAHSGSHLPPAARRATTSPRRGWPPRRLRRDDPGSGGTVWTTGTAGHHDTPKKRVTRGTTESMKIIRESGSRPDTVGGKKTAPPRLAGARWTRRPSRVPPRSAC